MKLSIIIVNWNTKDLLRDCLNSVYSCVKDLKFEVIVVDNASTDKSVEMLKKEFPEIRLIENEENVGFAKANNQAMRPSSGSYILLLNPDTIICDNAIEKMVEFMYAHPEAGAVSCQMVQASGKHLVGDAGYRVSLKTAINYAFFLSKFFPKICKGLFINHRIDNEKEPMEVDWISGAFFLVRRSILPRIGPMAENFFMFAEDIEWSQRIKRGGFKIYYLPYVSIIHLRGVSTSRQKQIKNISTLWVENLHNFYSREKSKTIVTLLDLTISTGLILRFLIYYLLYVFSTNAFFKAKYQTMITSSRALLRAIRKK